MAGSAAIWEELVADVVRHLERLDAAGVRFLNLAPDAELATLRPASPAAPVAQFVAAPARQLAPRAPQPDPPAPAVAPSETMPPRAIGEINTLESLYLRFRDCAQCKLAPTRNRLVFGVGNDRPRILFIGEGPGAEEDEQGLPFVGRAGQLLTGLIKAMGLVREDVYITNVVKCRPPGNRNPEPDEIAACRPILKRQIELLDPRLIVTLGNVPLKALNPDAGGITRERGRVFAYGRWRVLPTFHPSYILRSPDAIADCWADLRRAFALAYAEG
jgi:DNA polymerase